MRRRSSRTTRCWSRRSTQSAQARPCSETRTSSRSADMPKTIEPLHAPDSNLMWDVNEGNLATIADAKLRETAQAALKAGKRVQTNARGFLRVDDNREPEARRV